MADTGWQYQGEAVYLKRANAALADLHASRATRQAVDRAAREMLAVERMFHRRKGQRRADPKPVPPPGRHIDALPLPESVRLRLCDIAIDLASAYRQCHTGSAGRHAA
jgi:hypothetical protein